MAAVTAGDTGTLTSGREQIEAGAWESDILPGVPLKAIVMGDESVHRIPSVTERTFRVLVHDGKGLSAFQIHALVKAHVDADLRNSATGSRVHGPMLMTDREDRADGSAWVTLRPSGPLFEDMI